MNPLIILGAIPSALAVGALAWLLHTVDVGRIEASHRASLEAQIAADTAQCTKDKEITANASQAYQDQLSALNRQLNALRVRPKPRCVMLTPKPSNGAHGAPSQPKLVGPYGIDSGWLIEYAGEAETYRLQLIGLQDFVRKVWTPTP